MTRSMTGFARADVSSEFGKISLEISTINKRFLEINIIFLKNFSFLETEIRKLIKKEITRGQVLLKFDFFPSEKNILSLLPNTYHLKNLKKGWEKIATDLGYAKEDITLEFIVEKAKYAPDEKIKDITSLKKLIFKALRQALAKVIDMRTQEGKVLLNDIVTRINKIKKELVTIKKIAPDAIKKYEKKLKEKLTSLFKESKDIEERLLKEAALFADKVDISEEITRLDSHLKQFLLILRDKKEAIGRKLEFLLQECLRETNTIASKASDAKISKVCVEIKNELEKIKEQLQNIE